MKKKIAIWTVLILTIAGIGYFLVYFFFSPAKNLQGIYLVPKTAVYIIETEEPVKSWAKISNSEIWQHLQKNAFFSSVTESINSLDTLIKDNKSWIDLIGSRQVFISAHMTKQNDYDFLYLVDLQRVSKLSPLKSYIESLTSENFKTTYRDFNENEIIEITDLETRETIYLSFLNNILAVSYTHLLVEAAIAEMDNPVIGRDLQFLDVSKRADYGSMFRLYMNYEYLDEYLTIYTQDEDGYVKQISEALQYTGFSADISENNNISMKGYTSVDLMANPYNKALLKSGNGDREIFNITPQRTGFYMGLGFESFRTFVENMEEAYKANEIAYEAYLKNIDKLERFLDIDIQKNFFDWIDDEIAFVQTQPGKLGKDNEFLVILKAKDEEEATENLDFISDQIRKKTPVKFRQLNYEGYAIKYLSVKGFFKLVLGKFFSKLEKPYFTVIEDYVAFSNHPQTIKSFIDDYKARRTLGNEPNAQAFINRFENDANLLLYAKTPILYENLLPIANAETRKDLMQQKNYIVCFSNIGFQINNDGDLFSSQFEVEFQNPEEIEQLNEQLAATVNPFNMAAIDSIMQLTILEKDDELVIEDISPDDLDARKYTEYYDNGNLKIEANLKEGLKHGTYREYFDNGNIRVKGRYKNDLMDGNWKIYDENGNVVERKKFRLGKEL